MPVTTTTVIHTGRKPEDGKLTLVFGSTLVSMRLDESDFNKSPQELAERIFFPALSILKAKVNVEYKIRHLTEYNIGPENLITPDDIAN